MRPRGLLQARTPGPCSSLPQLPRPSLLFSIQEEDLLFGFYNLLHYYSITSQVTGSRIDFVSILAQRTWSAFIRVWFHFGFTSLCVGGGGLILLYVSCIWSNGLSFPAAPGSALTVGRPCP